MAASPLAQEWLTRRPGLAAQPSPQSAAEGITLNERVRVSGFDRVRRMVEAGLGVAILPSTAARPYAGPLRIVTRPLAAAWAMRPLALCTRAPATLSAAAKTLVQHLISSM